MGADKDSGGEDASPVEYMITAIADMLDGLGHVAVGARSPIPGSAAHLAAARSGGRLRVSILGSRKHSSFTDGARELFDCAGQGRIDAFFLSGGQIDGGANINLVGVGDIAAYPRAEARFPGSFGSAYLYYVVPRVILFTQEHSRRPGGPYALVTPRCVFRFDPDGARFVLASVHPGGTADLVHEATGFAYEAPDSVPVTPTPDADTLRTLRTDVARTIADTYPAFAAKAWGIGR